MANSSSGSQQQDGLIIFGGGPKTEELQTELKNLCLDPRFRARQNGHRSFTTTFELRDYEIMSRGKVYNQNGNYYKHDKMVNAAAKDIHKERYIAGNNFSYLLQHTFAFEVLSRLGRGPSYAFACTINRQEDRHKDRSQREVLLNDHKATFILTGTEGVTGPEICIGNAALSSVEHSKQIIKNKNDIVISDETYFLCSLLQLNDVIKQDKNHNIIVLNGRQIIFDFFDESPKIEDFPQLQGKTIKDICSKMNVSESELAQILQDAYVKTKEIIHTHRSEFLKDERFAENEQNIASKFEDYYQQCCGSFKKLGGKIDNPSINSERKFNVEDFKDEDDKLYKCLLNKKFAGVINFENGEIGVRFKCGKDEVEMDGFKRNNEKYSFEHNGETYLRITGVYNANSKLLCDIKDQSISNFEALKDKIKGKEIPFRPGTPPNRY